MSIGEQTTPDLPAIETLIEITAVCEIDDVIGIKGIDSYSLYAPAGLSSSSVQAPLLKAHSSVSLSPTA